MKTVTWIAGFAAFVVAGCAVNPVPTPVEVTDTAGATDAAGTDTALVDVAASDAGLDAAADGSATDAGGDADDGGADTGGVPGEYGFVIRKPVSHKVKCTNAQPGMPDSMDALDTDWLCHATSMPAKPYVYVQATPKSCTVMLGPVPSYDAKAWLSDGTTAKPLAGVTYDYGGGHNNDAAAFEHEGSTWRLDHSSFGFGFRKCQPMDCVVQLQGGKVVADGCTPERKGPVVCVPIEKDGTHKPLVDTFKKCLGDPNK